MSLNFHNVFKLDEYQYIQDVFARNMGVGSITVLPSGKPITSPSNFCHLCENYIRNTKIGRANCQKCNAEIGRQDSSGPIIAQCINNRGLWNAGVSIVVDGVHIASWCIGQVKNEHVDEIFLFQFAKEIGADTEGFKRALDEVPYMSKERFTQVANILYLFVNQLAKRARKNILLKQQLAEIKKTNELLIKSEKRYKLLFDQSNDAIFEVRIPDGQYIDANEAASRLTGRTCEEIRRLTTGNLTPKGASLRLQQIMDGKHKEITSQVEYIRPDGTKRHARLSVLPIDPHTLYGIAQDNTEQLKVTEALKHSRDLMQYIIEHNRSAIAIHDKDLKYIYVSQKYLEEYNVKDNNIIGKHHYEVFPDLPQKWREVHQKALKGEVISAEEDLYEREDGSVEWTRWECRPWYDQNKEIGGIIVYTEVITERKKMEIELRKSEEKYKFLFYNNPQPSWIYDLQTLSFLEVNDAAVLHYGYSREEFLNMTLKDIRPKEDIPKLMDDINNKVTPEYNNAQQWRHQKKNGEIINVEIYSHLIEYMGKHARHVLVKDITKRIKAEQEIIAAKEKAEESDRLKSAFLANMSHEIRTPLNGLLGFSELLIDPDFNEDEKKEFIEVIKQNSSRILTLINSILDISHIESGQVKLQEHTIRLASLLNTIHNNLSLEAIKKGIEFKMYMGSFDQSVEIITDGYRVTQILNNLLGNAIKFTEKGTIEFGLQLKGDYIQFFIKDTGIGIAKEFHQHIFERFWQVDQGLNRKFEGSGLGLTIAKSLVELLGGKIWLDSAPGKGSIFYFTIPYVAKMEDRI